jgi:hypothetical protein
MTSGSDPRWQLSEGYRLDLFDEQNTVSAEDVVALWVGEGAIEPAEAHRRVAEILLVATDSSNRLAGVSTAYLQRTPQLRAELWYIRAFVPAVHRQSNVAVQLALRARDHLQHRYLSGRDPRGIGSIFEVENEGLQRAFPEALWLPTDFLFIGENEDGDHVRVRYFPGAPAPEPPTPREPTRAEAAGYRIELFAEQSAVSTTDVVKLWTHEAALSGEEAVRRTSELLHVATDAAGQLAAVSTMYLRGVERLHAELWHFRVFVAPAHRQSELARSLALLGREDRIGRYVDGVDRRGIGIVYEVASPVLQSHLPQASWPETKFLYIGEDGRGYQLRVYYFPGAPAPEPPVPQLA